MSRAATAAFAALLILAAGPVAAQTAWTASEPRAPGASICPDGVCGREALGTVFAALAGTEAGTRDRPVHILQIGDSHTAGDRITGKLRSVLQARFGRAGRGVLPPGVPYDGYAPYQVRVTAAGWIEEMGPLQPPAGAPTPSLGLAGARATGVEGALMNLDLDPGAEVTRVGVCGRARGPGAGLSVEAGGLGRGLDFNGAGPGGEVCRDLTLAAPAGTVRLVPLGRGAVIDSVMLSHGDRGVMLSNLGVVGGTLRDLAARDEAIVATQLAAWRPDLIVLAFGANDGFDDALDPVGYEALLRGQILRMRRDAPQASLLILGAPDAERAGVENGCSGDGNRAPPPSLAVVRDVQRRVAADMGVAFWDWHGRMGGDCSADRLATLPEPLMRGDRVHFTSVGADWIGGLLADDLMAAYEASRSEAGGAA